MNNTWLRRWKKQLSQASRASLMFSIACMIFLYVSRYLGDHVSDWFAVPLMLGYVISTPAFIVATVLLGSIFPGWNVHPYVFILFVTIFNYLFYTAVVAAVRAYYYRADNP